MGPNDSFKGRRVAVGFGIETTPGTAVAPGVWMPHLSLDFQRRTTVIKNESALGRDEKISGSEVVAAWADGDFEAKVGDQSVGYILTNLFGTPSTTANPDASGVVKNHTFDISTNALPPALTVVRQDPKTNRRHAMGYVSDVEINIETGGWLTASGKITAQAGVTGTDSKAYSLENEFTSKHVVVKLANNVSGLAAASAIDLKSANIKLKRDVTPYIPLGSTAPSSMDLGEWEFEAEIVMRYKNTTYEDLWFANTVQALSITATNTDVTIGTSAKPSLTFTAPRTTLDTLSLSTDLGDYVEQTVTIVGELDLAAGYMIRALLTNTKSGYTA